MRSRSALGQKRRKPRASGVLMTLEPQVAVPTRRSAATDAECSAKASRGAAAGREVLDERRDIAEELRVAGGAKISRSGMSGHLEGSGVLECVFLGASAL